MPINKASIDIVHNPVQHDRTKRTEIDRHFKGETKGMCMPYVKSNMQLTDIFIKRMSKKGSILLCPSWS